MHYRLSGVAFFGLAFLSASASAAEQVDDELKAMVQEALDVAEAKLFRAGPKQPDWNKGGLDPKAAVIDRPGGLANNYLVTIDKDGDVSVSIYTTRPIANFVPRNWKLVARIGDIDAAEPNGFLDFSNLEGPYYMVARGTEKRFGDAFCESPLRGANLYKAPDEDGVEIMPAEVAKLIFQGAIEMASKYTVCQKYERSAKGYRVRSFLENGRTLPGMDESEDRIGIVPARPIAELLKPTAH